METGGGGPPLPPTPRDRYKRKGGGGARVKVTPVRGRGGSHAFFWRRRRKKRSRRWDFHQILKNEHSCFRQNHSRTENLCPQDFTGGSFGHTTKSRFFVSAEMSSHPGFHISTSAAFEKPRVCTQHSSHHTSACQPRSRRINEIGGECPSLGFMRVFPSIYL